MNKSDPNTILIAVHGVLLAAAIVAVSVEVAPLVASVGLVMVFAVGTMVSLARPHAAAPPAPRPSEPPAQDMGLARLLRRLRDLKAGDLSSRVEAAPGPLAPLALALNEATDQLEHVARSSHDAASSMIRASTEIDRSSRAVASGTGKQVATLAEVARRLSALGSRCEEVSQVVEVLDDLTRQTNVLALNAALEASRAGAAGRGFAMVADEVRKLSERSASATRDVGALVQGLEAGAAEASRILEEVRALTQSLAEGAEGTAAVCAELVTTTQGLAQRLDELQVESALDIEVKRVLKAKHEQVAMLLHDLEPLVADAQTPLARALRVLGQSAHTLKLPDTRDDAS